VLHHPVGPHARHQRVLASNLAARLDQRLRHVESAPAELDRPTVGKNSQRCGNTRKRPNATPLGVSESASIDSL
jgi:hypothetical protein